MNTSLMSRMSSILAIKSCNLDKSEHRIISGEAEENFNLLSTFGGF
jgi:hypothetical protein